MFLLLWHVPYTGHDQRNTPDYQPSLVRYDTLGIIEDDELLLLWWALNEATNY
jgi:hypothetical protein